MNRLHQGGLKLPLSLVATLTTRRSACACVWWVCVCAWWPSNGRQGKKEGWSALALSTLLAPQHTQRGRTEGRGEGERGGREGAPTLSFSASLVNASPCFWWEFVTFKVIWGESNPGLFFFFLSLSMQMSFFFFLFFYFLTTVGVCWKAGFRGHFDMNEI